MDLVSVDKQWLLALNGSESLFLDSLAKTLTTAVTWVPLYLALLYMVIKNSDHWKRVLLIVGCAALCVLLAGSIDDMLVKPLVARWRPTRDPDIGILTDIVNGYRGGRFGFFSAHASNTFSIAVFFMWLVRSRLLSITLVTWSLANCWTRVYLGVHFPGDILCGLVWGALVGTGVWMLFKKIVQQTEEPPVTISSQYTSTGFQHGHIDVVVCVAALTLAYATTRACLALYY